MEPNNKSGQSFLGFSTTQVAINLKIFFVVPKRSVDVPNGSWNQMQRLS